MKNTIIIDYGMGNIKSVQRGFEKVGAKVNVSCDPKIIASATHLVLPGVGAFKEGMNELRKAHLIDVIKEFVKKGNPLLGICLGMQMLLDRSEEHGNHKGIGLISGSVKQIPQIDNNQLKRKIPHIGWSELKLPNKSQNWNKTCLKNIKTGEYFYFVHSYMAVPINNNDILAISDYNGMIINAGIKRDNITGLQFHPEKSGQCGLKILENFVRE